MPSPTRRPAARNSASGATPQPSSAFERGQWTTGTSRLASRAISSDVHLHAVRAQERRAEHLGERRDAAHAGWSDEDVAAVRERAGPVLEPFVLVCALGQVRPDREPERQAPVVDVERAGVRGVRRDPDPDELGLGDACAQLVEPLLGGLRFAPEDLEVDDCSQAEVVCGIAGRARKAVVRSGRDPGRE